jgi:outer membrane immunogenic protein
LASRDLFREANFFNWRARAEYRYADYGTFSTNFGSPAQLAVAADIKVHTNTVLFGLAYAFGGG